MSAATWTIRPHPEYIRSDVTRRGRFNFLLALLAGLAAAGAATALAQRRDAFVASRDHPAIAYTRGPVADGVSKLESRIQAGSVQLKFERPNGYLRSLLAALDIPIESQTLVFSETSAEAKLINPRNPRSIFFNDTVSVGWVHGSDALEVAAADPVQGVIFYTLAQTPAAKPTLARDDSCLACHLSWETLGVPGIFVISTFPMSDDKNAYASGFTADHRSPVAERWGGWYVTGKPGPLRHMGNVPVIVHGKVDPEPRATSPVLASLDGKFDASTYLSPYSDVVALMVLDHQTRMTNLLTRVGWEARLAASDRGNPDAAARMREAATDLVDYLLFVDEAPFSSSIRGSSGFAEKFAAQGPRDSKGRSLRQLDLDHRLMRYPCSYMIYSPAFDAMPPDARAFVYQRMWQILSGKETGKRYASFARADRQAIVEILKDTKKNLPAYFQAAAQ
jgi:hypothetical protein